MTRHGGVALIAALAAFAGAGTTAFADSFGESEEIIVTAQKRQQSVLDVPIAITAYNGAFLDQLGIKEFDDLSRFVPGFEVQNQSPNNPGFVMRGITSDSGEATNEPRVSVFQDGVSISKSRGSYVELFDLERVEVAKGPQTTVFGRGALIGAVDIIQNKAKLNQFEWMGRATLGNYELQQYDGMLNVPLGQKVAMRFSGRYKTRDGYVDNKLGGGRNFNAIDTGAFRTAVNVTPSDSFHIDLIGNYQRDITSGTSFKSRSYYPADPTTGQVVAGIDPWDGAALAANGLGQAIGLHRQVWGLTALAEYEFNSALKLSSNTAFRHFNSSEVFDADGTGLPLLNFGENARGNQWSQEFRLNYDNGGRISGFVGASFFKDEGSQEVPDSIDERLAADQLGHALDGTVGGSSPFAGNFAALTDPALNAAALQAYANAHGVTMTNSQALGIANNLRTHNEIYTNYGKTRAYDFYGDMTFKITNKLSLTGGLRFSMETKQAGYNATNQNGRSILGGVVGVVTSVPSLAPIAFSGFATPGAAFAPANLVLQDFGIVSQPTNGTEWKTLHDSAFTWRAVANYKLTPNTNLYASYGLGRRPDVLSPEQPSLPDGPVRFTHLEAETVNSYEAGAKTYLPNAHLSLEGSLYLYNYDNFQTSVQQQNGAIVQANAGRASAYGFEAQTAWTVNEHLNLFLTYAFSHARFKTGLFNDNRFRLSPDHKLSVGAFYKTALFGGNIDVTPTYTWQSKIFFDDDNDLPQYQMDKIVPDLTQDEVQHSYGLINLRVGYEPVDSFWRLEAFCDNLADQKYIIDAGNSGDSFGLPTFVAGEPRFFGASLTLHN